MSTDAVDKFMNSCLNVQIRLLVTLLKRYLNY